MCSCRGTALILGPHPSGRGHVTSAHSPLAPSPVHGVVVASPHNVLGGNVAGRATEGVGAATQVDLLGEAEVAQLDVALHTETRADGVRSTRLLPPAHRMGQYLVESCNASEYAQSDGAGRTWPSMSTFSGLRSRKAMELSCRYSSASTMEAM